mmetsp:Transcript_2735/g.7086  ORF Transcript_2735/g.7086 Transcript_2735/m.7086 type:complete len:199 (-) Transcript_2735:264-860(-)
MPFTHKQATHRPCSWCAQLYKTAGAPSLLGRLPLCHSIPWSSPQLTASSGSHAAGAPSLVTPKIPCCCKDVLTRHHCLLTFLKRRALKHACTFRPSESLSFGKEQNPGYVRRGQLVPLLLPARAHHNMRHCILSIQCNNTQHPSKRTATPGASGLKLIPHLSYFSLENLVRALPSGTLLKSQHRLPVTSSTPSHASQL